ncbi:hypothetical protein OTSKARP_1279 [Orientia tsutsugamushi str. Karp]|nr:hypothetical protein OTSKARP_1279 [Orientia tsutsugamushi str. Karp]
MVFDEETQKSWPALTIFVKNERKLLELRYYSEFKNCNKADSKNLWYN